MFIYLVYYINLSQFVFYCNSFNSDFWCHFAYPCLSWCIVCNIGILICCSGIAILAFRNVGHIYLLFFVFLGILEFIDRQYCVLYANLYQFVTLPSCCHNIRTEIFTLFLFKKETDNICWFRSFDIKYEAKCQRLRLLQSNPL